VLGNDARARVTKTLINHVTVAHLGIVWRLPLSDLSGDSNSLGRPRTRHVDTSYQRWEFAPQVDPFVREQRASRAIVLWSTKSYNIECAIALSVPAPEVSECWPHFEGF
jgi:hypothetical protein